MVLKHGSICGLDSKARQEVRNEYCFESILPTVTIHALHFGRNIGHKENAGGSRGRDSKAAKRGKCTTRHRVRSNLNQAPQTRVRVISGPMQSERR